MTAITIHPEDSAQGTRSRPNPLVESTLQYLTHDLDHMPPNSLSIADIGCGKLRHLDVMAAFAKQLTLVDTEIQITRRQKFEGLETTMSAYVGSRRLPGVNVQIVPFKQFAKRRMGVDLAFSVAVMDVVLASARQEMVAAAYRNLRRGGYFVLIVPRNDSSIVTRCSDSNKYRDGHIFKNRGHDKYTFYRNFRDHRPLVNLLTKSGFSIAQDRSVYRQVCIIAAKS